MFRLLKFVLMHKINCSWWLDFYIRWGITYMQTIFAVPRVAWVNLLSLTRVIASWPGFHHLAAWCSIWLPGATFSFLTYLHLLASAFTVLLITQTNAYSGGTCSCHGEKQSKGELQSLSPAFLAGARHSFLQRQLQRGACPSGLAGAEGQQRLHGDLMCKRPWGGVLFVSIRHFFQGLLYY